LLDRACQQLVAYSDAFEMWPKMLRRPARSHHDSVSVERDRQLVDALERIARATEHDRSSEPTGNGVQKLIALAGFLSVLVAVLALWRPWAHAPPVARATLVPSSQNAIIPKSISARTEPPTYSPSESGDHCAKWNAWFATERAAQSFYPPEIAVSAPVTADVTVTNVTTHVFGSFVPAALAQILCVRGAGPIPGTELTLNLTSPSTRPTVAPEGGGKPLPMPGAVINVDAGHTEYISVIPRGVPRFYEWSVTLYLTVNQHPETRIIGSPSHPLRTWLGTNPTESYDYDVPTRSWRRVEGPGSTACANLPLSYCPLAVATSKAKQLHAQPPLVIDGRAMTACGGGVDVVSSYNCDVAQAVADALRQESKQANRSGAISLLVRSGLLILPISCETGSPAIVCKSTDDQDVIVSVSK
jgi:hypothetical protein